MTTSRITTVVAPDGYGKTTLVAAWLAELRSRGVPLAIGWLTLDESINDLRALLRHLAFVVRGAFPGLLPTYDALLDAVPGSPARQLVDELLRGLAMLPRQFVLVLDNYDELSRPSVVSAMKTIAAHQPTGLHLVVISRNQPDLLPRSWRNERYLTRIDKKDLLLTPLETQKYLEAVRTHPISDEEIKLVMQATGGIALRVAICGLFMPTDRQDLWRVFLLQWHSRKGSQILEQMVLRFIDERPPEERQLLVTAAILGYVNVKLVVAALDNDNLPATTRMLSAMAADQILLLPVGNDVSADGTRWSAMHRVLARIILGRYATDPAFHDLLADIRQRGADWLLSHGMIVQGLIQLRQANDDARLMRVIERLLPVLESEDRWHDVGRLLRLLPATLIDQSPELLVAQSWVAFLQRDTVRLTTLLNQAASLLGLRTDTESEPSVALLCAEIDVLRGVSLVDFPARGARRETMRRILRDLPDRRKWALAETLHALLLASITRPEIEETEQYLLDLLGDSSRPPTDPRLHGRLLVLLGLLYYRCGPVDKLEEVSLRVLDLGNQHGHGQLMSIAQMGLGTASYLRDDSAQAMIQLRAAIFSPNAGEMGALPLNAYHLIHSMARLGLADQIGVTLAQMTGALPADDSFVEMDWPGVQALGWLLSGDEAAAFRWADAVSLPPSTPSRSRFPFVLADVRLAQGDPDKMRFTLDYLLEYLSHLEQSWFPRNQTQALVLAARLAARLGEWDSAAAALEQAISIGYPKGFIRFLIDGSPELGELLRRLAQKDPIAATLLEQHQRRSLSAHDLADPHTAPTMLLLTRREMEILKLLDGPLNQKEIAHDLHLSYHTIRNHTASLYAKLGVTGRAGAVTRGRELGLLV